MPRIDTFDELMDRAKVAQQAIRDLNLNLVEAHDKRELQKLDRAIDTLHTLSQDIEPQGAGMTGHEMVDEQASPAPALAHAAQALPTPATPATPAATMLATVPAATASGGATATAAATPGAIVSESNADVQAGTDQPRVLTAAETSASSSPATMPAGPRPAAPRPPEAAAARPVAAQPPRAAPAAPKPVVTPSTAPTTFQEQISKGIYTRRIGRVFSTGSGMGMVPIGKMPHREGLPAFDNCLAPDDTPVDGAYGVFVSTTYVFAAVLRRPFESHRWKVIETINCRQQREIVDAVAHLLRRPTMNIIVED